MESAVQPDMAAKPAHKPEPKKEGAWELVRFFFILFLGAILLRSFIVAPFNIPSGSMLPRLMIGDYLFVSKWPYGYSRFSMPFGLFGFQGRVFDSLPERGDVAVFRYPGPQNEDWVKRVIGLPGDTLEVRDGTLHLNGQPIQRHRVADFLMRVSPNSPCRTVQPELAREVQGEDGGLYCAYARYRETLPGGRSYFVLDQLPDGPGDNTPPVTVPEGHVFVMGDNRDDSFDSRFDRRVGGVALLPVDRLLGRALITFWSTDGSASWVKPWTWFTAARWERIGQTSE